MKIPASLRRLFEDQKAINERLKESVDARMQSLKDPRWHYESRVKELPSFALKIESGRFPKPEALEDFFACTLVVANANEIAKAEQIVRENFTLLERRPKRADQTHKAADAFPFDDLRLYVSLPVNLALPESEMTNVTFEVQIKTFLQHAWSIATHDLLYKAADPNWSTARIAFQIKAMLEHAEISIQEAERLATCNALAKEDRATADVKKGIALVKGQWHGDELPGDVRRLAENISTLLTGLRIEAARLEEVLIQGKAQRAGAHPANLSPYAIVVQYLFSAEKEKMVALLERHESRTKILIPEEVELPADVDRARLRNAIFVGTA
jgi:ppGpp synthetase/RelA/SpoT-type nucleotidyltranferase